MHADPNEEVPVRMVEVPVCVLCLSDAGGECHVPGCIFWMRDAPETPLLTGRATGGGERRVDQRPQRRACDGVPGDA